MDLADTDESLYRCPIYRSHLPASGYQHIPVSNVYSAEITTLMHDKQLLYESLLTTNIWLQNLKRKKKETSSWIAYVHLLQNIWVGGQSHAKGNGEGGGAKYCKG